VASHSRKIRRAGIVALVAFAPGVFAETAPTPSTPRAPDDWVTLTLVTDDSHVALYVQGTHKIGVGDETVDSWSFVCQEPCGIRIDPRRVYRVMGESLIPSVQFNLAPGSGHVSLQVHPKKPVSTPAVVTLATAGAIATLGGVLFLLLDLAEHGAANALSGSSSSAQASVTSDADTYGEVGAGMLAGGVALGTATLVYLATAGRTELAPAASKPVATSGSDAPRVRLIPMGFSF
jgi:hypothetical protein